MICATRPVEISRRARAWSALLCALLLVGPTLGCSEAASTPAPETTAPPVMVVPVAIRDVVERIDATGQLRAKAAATVAAQVDGQVTGIAVEEGDPVEAGQILLEIDPQRRQLELADAEAGLAEARAQVKEARREVARITGLRKRDAASQAQFDQAQTDLALAVSRERGAEARLGLAWRALEDATIRAPFAGLIARRHTNVGEYLGVGVPLFDVVALDPIEAEFTLSEVDSARVAVGNEVGIRVAPYPDERFDALVTVIAPTIDPSTRTLRVKAEISNPDGRLRPGLFAHVDVGVAERQNVTMVPEDALVQRAEGAVLYRLVDGNRVQRMVVEPGLHSAEWVEVRAGLSAGDRVVVRGQRDLIDGGAVSVRTRDGRPADEPQVATPAAGMAVLLPGAGR